MMTMDLGPHAAFIVSAYAAALVIVLALIAWVALERRYLARMLDEFEAQGITRRAQRLTERQS
jgi:heme exporter protein D